MHKSPSTPFARRQFIGGGLALSAALTLPACAGTQGFSLTEAVRRLLLLSSENAFARLTADGGFWDQEVAKLGLSEFLGFRGNVLIDILTSALVKDRLEDAFAGFAVDASERAAPFIAEIVSTVGITNAVELVRGGPTAATAFLAVAVGDALINEIVPELGDAIRISQEPLVADAINRLAGIEARDLAASLSYLVNNTIWEQIGAEEALIRANPRATNDPLIIGVFELGRML